MKQIVQTMYNGQQLRNGMSTILRVDAPFTGTLTKVEIILAQNMGLGVSTFNIKHNGVYLWSGVDRPQIGSGSRLATKSGLSVATSLNDVFTLDLIQLGQGHLISIITLRLTYEDHGVASQFMVNLTTGNLADLAYEIGMISFGEAFTLEQVVRDYNCRVQLYQTASARTADASRPIGTDPSNVGGNGIICDLNLESGEPLRWQMAPPSHGFNGDVPEQSVVYYRIQNRSGSTRAINLTFIGTIERKK